jgi:hypothetical protein
MDEFSSSDCPSFQRTASIPMIDHSNFTGVIQDASRQLLQSSNSNNHLGQSSTTHKVYDAKKIIEKQKESCIAYCQARLYDDDVSIPYTEVI